MSERLRTWFHALPKLQRAAWIGVALCLVVGPTAPFLTRTLSPTLAVSTAAIREGTAFRVLGGWKWKTFLYGGEDPWGNPWRRTHVRRSPKDPYYLSGPYSTGPDGKDDDGSGDDVWVPRTSDAWFPGTPPDQEEAWLYALAYAREGLLILALLLVWSQRAPFLRSPRRGFFREAGKVLVLASLPTALVLYAVHLASTPMATGTSGVELYEVSRPWVEDVNQTVEPLDKRMLIPVRGALFGSALAVCLVAALGYRLFCACPEPAGASVTEGG